MTNPWFQEDGLYITFDGQFGSAGKGLLAAWLGHQYRGAIDMVTSNAGPNSGHTFYWPGTDVKECLRQLPVSAVVISYSNNFRRPLVYLNAGAVIDREILIREMKLYPGRVVVHRNAACILEADLGLNPEIASTGSG